VSDCDTLGFFYVERADEEYIFRFIPIE
jgi:hypothetical protein